MSARGNFLCGNTSFEHVLVRGQDATDRFGRICQHARALRGGRGGAAYASCRMTTQRKIKGSSWRAFKVAISGDHHLSARIIHPMNPVGDALTVTKERESVSQRVHNEV